MSEVTRPSRRFLSVALVDNAAIANLTIVAAAADKRVRVYQIVLGIHAAQVWTFRDTTPTVLLPQQNQSLVLDYNGMPIFETAVGAGLVLVLTTAAQTSALIWYTQETEVLP